MIRYFIKYWLPVLLCSFVMYFFSTGTFSASHTSRFIEPLIHWLLPHASHATRHTIHFFVRKAGHFSEYFILALLIHRAWRGDQPQAGNKTWAALTLLLILLYALGDEFHQSFVPSRTGCFTDALLDFFGGSCAIGLKYLWHWRPAARGGLPG